MPSSPIAFADDCTPSAVWRAHTRPAGAKLLRLLDELVDLAARELRGAGNDEAAHRAAVLDRLAEDAERRLGEQRTEVLNLEAEAQVGLVGAVLRDRLGVRHAPERPRNLDADRAEGRGERAFDDVEDQLGRRKRHLEVDLRELELSIGALILVAEAARELHVAIHARDHQDLLEDLRRLRQREELAGMHAARHEKVARAFGRGLGEDRRLDFPEALLVEVVPQRQRDAVAQPDVALQPRPPQIEVAVLEPRSLRRRWRLRKSGTAASSPR